ncbi:energy transducer TonB [Anthocerotibacter panamensis]|uniref:energy transducer TonB n=1 Tax=Anthocerotibacter panamensis TaxID=2857077 RepID=UPI001C404CA2|nr:energy transducer TonB [Anthocerotibacter panamensis]
MSQHKPSIHIASAVPGAAGLALRRSRICKRCTDLAVLLLGLSVLTPRISAEECPKSIAYYLHSFVQTGSVKSLGCFQKLKTSILTASPPAIVQEPALLTLPPPPTPPVQSLAPGRLPPVLAPYQEQTAQPALQAAVSFAPSFLEAQLLRERPDGVLVAARPLAAPQTHYPEEDRNAGHQGVALIQASVSARGIVTKTRVLRSSGWPSLDKAARSAVLNMEFMPARRGLEPPQPALVEIPVPFSLEDAPIP